MLGTEGRHGRIKTPAEDMQKENFVLIHRSIKDPNVLCFHY